MSGLEKVLRRLRVLRKKQALTQDELAVFIGVSRSTYVRKEQGNIPVTTEEWIKLAECLGVEAGYFFEKEGEPIEALADGHGNALLSLYGSLNMGEQKDLLRLIEIAFKGIKRKNVRDAIAQLSESCGG